MYFNDGNNYPKIESKLKDVWSVTEEHQVGSERRSEDSNYTLWTSANEHTTGIILALGLEDLQIMIESLIYFNPDTDLITMDTSLGQPQTYVTANCLNIGGSYYSDPTLRSLRIQTVEAYDCEIRLTEFGRAYTVSDFYGSTEPHQIIHTNLNTITLVDYGSKIAIRESTGINILYLSNGRYQYTNYSRPISPTSICYDKESEWEWALEESSNIGAIYYADNASPEFSGISQTKTDAKFVIITDKRNDERVFYIEHTNSKKINKIVRENISGTPSTKYSPVLDIEFYDDDTYLVTDWHICTSGDCFNLLVDNNIKNSFIGGVVNTSGEQCYIYDNMNPYVEEEYNVIPLSHYKGLNSSENLTYVSNSGETSNNLTCNNVTASPSVKVSGYYAIQALSSNSAYCVTSNSIDFGSSDFSIVFWANTDSQGHLLSLSGTSLSAYIDTDNDLKVDINGSTYNTGLSYLIDIKSWFQVAITRNDAANTVDIYVNNTRTNHLTGISYTFPDSALTLNRNSAGSNYSDCIYLDLRIYMRELTEANIDYLYNSSIGTFSNFESIRFRENIDFSQERILNRIDGYFDSIVYINDYMGYEGINFLGGSKIVSYNGNDFVVEMSFEYDNTVNTQFVTQRDSSGKIIKLFFIRNSGGTTEIYERLSIGNWTLQKVEDRPMIPIIQTETTEKQLQDVLFMESSTNKVFVNFGDGNSIYLDNDGTNPSGIKGFKIVNTNVLNKSYETIGNKDIISSAYNSLSSTDINNDEISYCTIEDTIGCNGIYELFNINHTKVDVVNNCLRFYNTGRFEFDSNCEYNLFLNKQGWAIYLEGNGYTFNSSYFQNNTIKSYNGFLYNSFNLPILQNNIIMSVFYALSSKVNASITIRYSLIYGRLDNPDTVTNESSNLLNVNPLFLNVDNDDYRLQHKALDYPENSPCIGNDSTGEAIGCYKDTYTNLGEVNKEGFELYGFNTDIMYDWKYPKEEITHDYTSNILKYTGKRRRILRLTKNAGELDLRILTHLSKLYQEIKPIRFYPNGSNHFSMLALHTVITNNEDKILTWRERRYREYFTSEIALTFDFTTEVTVNNIEYTEIATIMPFKCNLSFTAGSDTATFETVSNDFDISLLQVGMIIENTNLPVNTKIYNINTTSNEIILSRQALSTVSDVTCDIYQYYFFDGFLKGFYIGFIDNSGSTFYMRIDENNEKTLYLRTIDEFSANYLLFDATFTSGSNQATVDTGTIDINSLKKGLVIICASLPDDTYILDVDYDTNVITLNYNATASGSDTVTTNGFVSFIDFMYVTYGTKPELRYGLWTSSLQKGDLNSIEFHELEDKYEDQSSMEFEIIE